MGRIKSRDNSYKNDKLFFCCTILEYLFQKLCTRLYENYCFALIIAVPTKSNTQHTLSTQHSSASRSTDNNNKQQGTDVFIYRTMKEHVNKGKRTFTAAKSTFYSPVRVFTTDSFIRLRENVFS